MILFFQQHVHFDTLYILISFVSIWLFSNLDKDDWNILDMDGDQSCSSAVYWGTEYQQVLDPQRKVNPSWNSPIKTAES